MSAGISQDEIRRMVRELLRDAVAGSDEGAPPRERAAALPRSGEVGGLSERVRAALAGGPGGVVGGGGIEIAIAGDADLNAFARQVALCALERDLLGAIASNRVRFRLAGARRDAPAEQRAEARSASAAPPAAPNVGGEAYHWEQGLLSETKVTEIARTHAKLVLGRRALLTPLAWDRARSLGLQVARMKS
ncbi:MAG: hypothetical protein R3285_02995 [Kiloniellales bacterium]|nr:hypothetical protein [Kiloniellales bacterium]